MRRAASGQPGLGQACLVGDDDELRAVARGELHQQAAVSFTIPVPVVAGSGTGSYKGITGDFTLGVTADEALAGAPSGVGEPCTHPQRRAWEVIILAGPGTVSA